MEVPSFVGNPVYQWKRNNPLVIMKTTFAFDFWFLSSVKQHGYWIHINIEIMRSCQWKKVLFDIIAYHCIIIFLKVYLMRSIFHNFYTLSLLWLFMAMLSYHVQLSDLVLKHVEKFVITCWVYTLYLGLVYIFSRIIPIHNFEFTCQKLAFYDNSKLCLNFSESNTLVKQNFKEMFLTMIDKNLWIVHKKWTDQKMIFVYNVEYNFCKNL